MLTGKTDTFADERFCFPAIDTDNMESENVERTKVVFENMLKFVTFVIIVHFLQKKSNFNFSRNQRQRKIKSPGIRISR